MLQQFAVRNGLVDFNLVRQKRLNEYRAFLLLSKILPVSSHFFEHLLYGRVISAVTGDESLDFLLDDFIYRFFIYAFRQGGFGFCVEFYVGNFLHQQMAEQGFGLFFESFVITLRGNFSKLRLDNRDKLLRGYRGRIDA